MLLVTALKLVGGKIAIITGIGNTFFPNARRLAIRCVDTGVTGEGIDMPLFDENKQQFVCQTDKADEILTTMMLNVLRQLKTKESAVRDTPKMGYPVPTHAQQVVIM